MFILKRLVCDFHDKRNSNLLQNHTKDVIVGEKRTENELGM
jgi:hypothetical protein